MKKWKPVPPPFKAYKRKEYLKLAKTSQMLYQIGEFEALRKKSKEVPIDQIKTSKMKAKFKYLKDCLKKYRKITGVGRGITAVQLGIPERFSVVYSPKKLLIIINPKITKVSQEKYIYPEICMSAAPVIAPTVRPAWIEFEYWDENGKKKYWKRRDNTKLGKILNRVFQHEADHMEGIINIDRVKSRDLIMHSDPKFYDNAKFEKVK